MREQSKLSDKACKNTVEPGRYGDGAGLWLQVTASETEGNPPSKSWLFRFMLNGRAREMGLGPYPTRTLAAARAKAQEARALLLDGIDPIERRDAERRAAAEAAAKVWTFQEAAEKFIAANKAGWRNEKHADQVEATLKAYAYPVLGKLDVKAIDMALVLKVIEPIWATKNETASRVRGRIENVLDFAKAHGRRQGENPARWKGNLDHVLPAKGRVHKVKHFAALPYAEIAAFMADLRGREATAARALEFTILTACRTNEALQAKRGEIDLDAKLWTIPAERTKSHREHRVPLSERAVEIVKALPAEEGSDWLFLGDTKGKPPSGMAMAMLLRRMGREDLTVHGFRSTFRDWAAERTSYPNEMVELALAHVVDDKTEAAYRRGDMMDRRRKLMQSWADFCAKAPAKGGNVTALRARA